MSEDRDKIEATISLFKHLAVREQLQSLSNLNGIKQAVWSAATGLSPSYISNFLTGRKSLKVDDVEEMAKAVGYRLVLMPMDVHVE